MEAPDFDLENLFSIFENSITDKTESKNYDEFLIAYSGGIDSTALLYFSKKIARKLNKKIKAIHVNHNLNKESIKCEKHCSNFCKDIEVPLTIKNLNIVIFTYTLYD